VLSEHELTDLDGAIEHALLTGDESGLRVLGYGEISLVVGWPSSAPRVAAKRLPVFADRARAERATALIERTIDELRVRGVDVVPTDVRILERADRTVAAYALQSVVPADTLAPNVLRRSDPGAGHPVVDAIVAAVHGAIDERFGLDSQVANWVWDDLGLHYLDVTTPLVSDAAGRIELDLDVLVQSMPWLLRAPVKRFVAPDVVHRFQSLRPTYLDLCGNLLKERLDAWLPHFVDAVNRVLLDDITQPPAREPVTVEEVRRFYRSDARLWQVLLAVRRADRWWQRTVRRRPYPFLLPGPIDR
jgi:hypothetical protein